MQHFKRTKNFLKHNVSGIICSLLLILTISCQQGTIYHTYLPVSPYGWHRQDTLRYPLPKVRKPGIYLLEIGIRNNNMYPYRDIWLETIHHHKKDTLHLYLADEQGRWKGEGTSGSLFQHQEPEGTIRLDTGYTDTLLITHLMNDSLLKGINDIGVKLQK